MDRYRNNYNNSFEDEHSGGTWVYMNGELYHAGVKGMHWYQHLPGTDYWKVAKKFYSTYMNANKGEKEVDDKGNVTVIRPGVSRMQGLIRTAKHVGRRIVGDTKKYIQGEASYYGNKAKTALSKVSSDLKDFAKNAWGEIRGKTQAVFKSFKGQEKIDKNTSVKTLLDEFQSKQYNDAKQNYIDGKTNGSVGNTINQFIQNAQFGIVKGINNYLKKMGWDDEVDSFLGKMTGRESNAAKNRRLESYNQSINYGNTSGMGSKQADIEARNREAELKKRRRQEGINRSYYNRPNIVDPKWRQ